MKRYGVRSKRRAGKREGASRMMLSTTALAPGDAPKLAAALQRAEIRIRQLEQENNALHQEIRWIDKLLAVPASIMSPSHKVTLRAAVKAYLAATPNEHGMVSIASWKVCQQVGQSKDTFLKNLTYCAEKLGILRKQVVRPGLADGDFSATLSIGVTDLLAHPEKYVVATPRQHGGLRQICPHCHSDRLKKQVIIVCQDCGAIVSEHTSEINPNA